MKNTRRGKTLAVGIACATSAWCLGPANADTNACGLETGTWASPVEACQFADRRDEAVKRFGEQALLEWYRGYYRFQGANCTIFSDELAGKRCTLRVECAYQRTRAMGEWDIEIETARRFRFGTRPDSPIYSHCSGDPPP